MADKLITDLNGQVLKRYKDMGDSTHAEVVYVSGLLKPANSFAIIGDSRAAKYHSIVNVSGAGASNTCANGVITVNSNAHTRIPGERINLMNIVTIGGVSALDANGSYTVLDILSANQFRVDTGQASFNGAVVGPASNGSNFQYSSNRDLSAEGWIAWAMQLSGDSVRVFDNFAIGGSGLGPTSKQNAFYQVDKAIALGVRNIILDCSINDINARSDSEDTIWSNIKAIWSKCVDAGVTLWDCSTAHLATGYGGYSNAESGYTNFGHKTNVIAAALNERRRRFAQMNTNYIYVPVAEALINPDDTTGATLAANMTDGIHDSVTGARKAGAVLATMIAARFPMVNRLPYTAIAGYSRQGAVSRYVNSNPLFNDGAETSGLAAGWAENTSNTSATKSTVARTVANDGDTNGRNQVCVITATAAGSYSLRSSGSSQYTVTDVLRALADIKLTGMSNVTYLSAYVSIVMKNSLGVDTTYFFQAGVTGLTFDQTDIKGWKPCIPDISWPVGFSDPASKNCGFWINVGFGGAGGATLYVGGAPIEKLLPM